MPPRRKGYHRHHIKPKWEGGTDDDENIQYVTLDEHVRIHQERYEQYGHDQDRRAVLLLTKQVHPNVLRQQTKVEHLTRIAYIAHEKKLENGFYNRLGHLNSARLKGIKNPAHTEIMKLEWKKNPRKWWTDGVKTVRSVDCPGEGWIRGRTKMKKVIQNGDE